MKINLPCEIVMDLLPSYIDELTSEMSREAVDEHLKECKKCKNVLGKMKKDLDWEKQTEKEELKGKFGEDLQRDSTFDEDKKILLKIKKKIKTGCIRCRLHTADIKIAIIPKTLCPPLRWL